MDVRGASRLLRRRFGRAVVVALALLGAVAPAGHAQEFSWGVAISVEHDTVGGGYDMHDTASFEGGSGNDAIAWRAYSYGSGRFPCGDGAVSGFEDRSGGGTGSGRFQVLGAGTGDGESYWNGESRELKGDRRPHVLVSLIPEGDYRVDHTGLNCNGDRSPSWSRQGPTVARVLLPGTLKSLARLPKGTVRRNQYSFVAKGDDGVTSTYTVRVLAVKGRDPADRDHDFTPDAWDGCPDEPGAIEHDGCPRDPRCTRFGLRARRTWDARVVLAGFRDLDIGRFGVDVKYCTGDQDYARITSTDVSGSASSNVTGELLDFFFGFSPQYEDEQERVLELNVVSRQVSGRFALCFDWTWLLGVGKAEEFIEKSMKSRLAEKLKEAAERIGGVKHDTQLWRVRFLKSARKVFKQIAKDRREALERWVMNRSRPLPRAWRQKMAQRVGASYQTLAGPAMARATKWVNELPDDTRNLLFGQAAGDLLDIFFDHLSDYTKICTSLSIWRPIAQVDVFADGAANLTLSGYRNPLMTWAVKEL